MKNFDIEKMLEIAEKQKINDHKAMMEAIQNPQEVIVKTSNKKRHPMSPEYIKNN